MKIKLKKLFINHLGALQKQFSLYFKDIDVSGFELVRNPFAANIVTRLATCEQEQLIDISSYPVTVPSDRFDEGKRLQFWLLLKNDHPSLLVKEMKVLFPFVKTHS
jgi:hypothetical protein